MAGPEAEAWQPEAGRRDSQAWRQQQTQLWRLRPVRPIQMPAVRRWPPGLQDTTARRQSSQGEVGSSVATAVQRCSSRTEEKQPSDSRSDPVGFKSRSISITEAPRFASSFSDQGGPLVRMPLALRRAQDRPFETARNKCASSGRTESVFHRDIPNSGTD